MLQKISALRSPPIVGETYLVPTFRHADREDVERDWPMIGHPHRIALACKKNLHHWHVDSRFLTPEQEAIVRRKRAELFKFQGRAVPFAFLRLMTDAQRFTAEFHPFVCRYAQPWDLNTDAEVAEVYGPVAAALIGSGGRSLCPHERIDLSQFEPNTDGTVGSLANNRAVRWRRPSA